MSTIDTSTWNPDPDLNESLEGIPLNSDASIAQTWQALRILMAAGGKHGQTLATIGRVTEAQIDSIFENDGVVPMPDPVSHPERAVLCGDGVWRYFGQIPF